MTRPRLACFCALVVSLAAWASASAHELVVVTRLDGDRVRIQVTYEGGVAVDGGRVQVFVQSPDENVGKDVPRRTVVDAKLGRDGVVSFARPAEDDLVIVVDDGAGHRERVEVSLVPGATDPIESIGEWSRFSLLVLGVVVITALAALLRAARGRKQTKS